MGTLDDRADEGTDEGTDEAQAELPKETPEAERDRVLPDDFERLRAAECAHMDRSGGNLWGLAISGGGIRSASFGLGLLQALHAKPLDDGRTAFERLDYLSTVSGGGYIGSALTWFRYVQPIEGIEEFPFGRKHAGGRVEAVPQNGDGAPRPDAKPNPNIVLDFLRQHGRYLTPGAGLNSLSLVGVVLGTMFVSLSVYLALATAVLAWAVIPLGLLEPVGSFAGTPQLLRDAWPAANSVVWTAMIFAVLLALLAVAFSVATFFRQKMGVSYTASVVVQKLGGLGVGVLILLGVVGSLPYVAERLGPWAAEAAGGATGVGALLGYLEFRQLQKVGLTEGMVAEIRVHVGAAAALYGTLLAAYILGSLAANGPFWALAFPLVYAAAVGLLVNTNYSGLHRMYRDRLTEAFLANEANVKSREWGPATKARTTSLADVADCSEGRRPYHLINTNVVLVDAKDQRFRGRGGDSFLLSPLYCGSYATGWTGSRGYGGGDGITLGSAMAISGAALNPNAGVGGRGLTRTRSVSLLLSLLNLRLGYWAPNPRRPSWLRSQIGSLERSVNYFTPGLPSLLGRGYREDAWDMELTDGGHFENLALYELVRRRVDVIIASDAGADPKFRFADLANAVQRVRTDFGVHVTFREAFDVDGVRPSAEDPVLGKQVAKRPYAVADLRYPRTETHSAKKGILIYIKSTLVSRLPADIIGYALANDAFPDQTTADQFFDEAQFEAYRELGYRLGERTLYEVLIEERLIPDGLFACDPHSSETPEASPAMRVAGHSRPIDTT